MKIYVAGPACEQDLVREAARILVEHGHEITSTWLDHDVSYSSQGVEERLPASAVMDFKDVSRADAIMVINEPGSAGGMHTELGIALGLGKMCFLIGKRTQVFHWHHKVIVYEDILTWIQKHS